MKIRRVLGAALVAVVAAGLFAPLSASQDEDKMRERDISRYLKEAEKRIEDEKPAEAGGFYLTILESFPERGDVRLLLARVYRQVGELDNMANAYSLAVDHLTEPSEISECYEGMTEAYIRAANYPKALEAGRKAIELNPQSPTAHIAVALSMAKTGDLAEAATMARKALELAPDSAVAHSTLGEASMAEGNMEEAESSFRKALELDPNTAESHAGLAEILYAKDDFAGAVSSASKAIELNDQLTRARGIRGKANNALGNSDEAYSDLAMAITVNANDPDANLAFAQVYESQGNVAMAESYYRKTVQLNPSLISVYEPLSKMLLDTGKYDDAVNILQQGVAQKPDSAELHIMLGSSQELAGNATGALASFDKAMSLDDSLAEAHFRKGKILRENPENKDPAAALASLEKAISLEADRADILTQLGIAQYENQQLDAALTSLEKASSSEAYSDMLGLAYLGVALKDKQRYAEAQGYFERVVEAVPNYGMAHWGLAWSAFGQIATGCPCTPEDEALVEKLVAHSAKAVELGADDAALTERAEILARGEKVK